MVSKQSSNSVMYHAQQQTCNIFLYIQYFSQHEIWNVPFEVPTGRHVVFEIYATRVQFLWNEVLCESQMQSFQYEQQNGLTIRAATLICEQLTLQWCWGLNSNNCPVPLNTFRTTQYTKTGRMWRKKVHTLQWCQHQRVNWERHLNTLKMLCDR
jgi:hypothetical protein